MISRLKAFLILASRRQDLALAAVLIATVTLMVLPIPTWLVDMLIGCNLSMAVLLLMVAIYLRTPLDFSALPGVILISTVFRLSMAVTTTRLILVQADAGQIVTTFGEFVIAGNVVVGVVVFLIITIVQFLVVTKGAERVAEVGARFTLDALPGKQMSIDADLRSGEIDGLEARRRRRAVEKESQLHGAMDGAMKFVKGDAIAGLIIIFVNLIGGIGIGVVQRGLPVAEAMRTYTLLTIGDALISQIPALFLSITAAIIVTRVGGEDVNLGRDIVGQLIADRRALGLSSVVLVGMALVPGFPAPVFLLLALVFGAGALHAKDGFALPWKSKGAAAPAPAGRGERAEGAKAPQAAAPALEPKRTAPVHVTLSAGLAEALTRSKLDHAIMLAREQVTEELGTAAPEVDVRTAAALGGMRFTIDLEGVPVEHGAGRPGHLLLRDDPAHLRLLGITPEIGPAVVGDEPSRWAPASEEPRLVAAGIAYNDCAEAIAYRVRAVLQKHAPSFLGIQEAKAILARVEREYGDLVREVNRVLPIQKTAEVLRRLLEEGVSVRMIRLILETLAEWSERESRVVFLTEYVRAALSRQICHRYASPEKVLSALILEESAEQAVRGALRETASGIYLALDAAASERIVAIVRARLEGVDPAKCTPVVVCSLDVRRYVRGLLVKNGLEVAVLSYQELAADFTVQPIGSVGLDRPAQGPAMASVS